MEFAEELAPGRAVAVDLATGGRVAGCVHALDAAAGLVTLEEAESARLVLVALAQVKKILRTLTDIAGRNATNTVRADARAAREREAGVLSERKERYLEIGVGVSRAGQEVFDTLKKNFPVKWINESVRIFDSVTLLPPYGVDNISAEGDADVKRRVRQVLEGRRAKRVGGAGAGVAAAGVPTNGVSN